MLRQVPGAVSKELSVGGFNSYHSLGSMFLMADGSVRFITNSIQPELRSQIGNRHDHQLISQDF